MALQLSVPVKTALLAGFKPLFDGGVIRVFSGSQPTSANDAETGTFLGAITRNGVPLGYGDYAGLSYVQNGPYILHDSTFLFGFTPVATGAASWFRVVGPGADDGGASFSHPRVDGVVTAVGDGGQLQLPSTSVVSGSLIIPISFLYAIPPL